MRRRADKLAIDQVSRSQFAYSAANLATQQSAQGCSVRIIELSLGTGLGAGIVRHFGGFEAKFEDNWISWDERRKKEIFLYQGDLG